MHLLPAVRGSSLYRPAPPTDLHEGDGQPLGVSRDEMVVPVLVPDPGFKATAKSVGSKMMFQ